MGGSERVFMETNKLYQFLHYFHILVSTSLKRYLELLYRDTNDGGKFVTDESVFAIAYLGCPMYDRGEEER